MKKRAILTMVVFMVLVLLFPGFIHGAIPASERAALIALYNSTDGDHWTKNGGWKTPPLHTDGFAMPGTEGNWFRVTLTGDNVTRLSVGENHLSGGIPSQLGNLSQLISLSLDINQLSGGIPSELGKLTALERLDLGNNLLNGIIPSSFLNLKIIRDFDILNNCLWATDPAIRAWLNSHDPKWEDYQNQCKPVLPK